MKCEAGVMHSTMFQPPHVRPCGNLYPDRNVVAVFEFESGDFPVCKHHFKTMKLDLRDVPIIYRRVDNVQESTYRA